MVTICLQEVQKHLFRMEAEILYRPLRTRPNGYNVVHVATVFSSKKMALPQTYRYPRGFGDAQGRRQDSCTGKNCSSYYLDLFGIFMHMYIRNYKNVYINIYVILIHVGYMFSILVCKCKMFDVYNILRRPEMVCSVQIGLSLRRNMRCSNYKTPEKNYFGIIFPCNGCGQMHSL